MSDDIAKQLYMSLRCYPCRCVYVRSDVRPVYGKNGERVLQSRCSRCEAIENFEKAVSSDARR